MEISRDIVKGLIAAVAVIGTVSFITCDTIDLDRKTKIEESTVTSFYSKAAGEDRILDTSEKRKFLDYFGFKEVVDNNDCLYLRPTGAGIDVSLRAGSPTQNSLGKFGTSVTDYKRYLGRINMDRAEKYLSDSP